MVEYGEGAGRGGLWRWSEEGGEDAYCTSAAARTPALAAARGGIRVEGLGCGVEGGGARV